MSNKKKINLEYSIGVVTYVARFEEFFIPLINQLVEVFPDKEIICIINGHHDEALQINYLKQVTAFLNKFPNVHYITNEKHQSLAKCFNWIAMMSFAKRSLIINDDVSLNLLFRKQFEKVLENNSSFFIINKSWSHFLISKSFMKEVGWFEERLLGTGQEDGDYINRILAKGKDVPEFVCHGIVNYVAPQENAGWANISEKTDGGVGKYSAVNNEFFDKKYSKSQDGKSLVVKEGMETPMFYELSNLDSSDLINKPPYNTKEKPSFFLTLLLPFNVAYSYSRKSAGKLYRGIKRVLK